MIDAEELDSYSEKEANSPCFFCFGGLYDPFVLSFPQKFLLFHKGKIDI